MRKLVLSALVALAVGAALGGSAHADGDPASDTLVIDNVFLPMDAQNPKAASALAKEVARVYARG